MYSYITTKSRNLNDLTHKIWKTRYQMALTSYSRELKTHFHVMCVILALDSNRSQRGVMLSTPGLKQLNMKVWVRGRSLASFHFHIYWLERGSQMRGQIPLPHTLHTVEYSCRSDIYCLCDKYLVNADTRIRCQWNCFILFKGMIYPPKQMCSSLYESWSATCTDGWASQSTMIFG